MLNSLTASNAVCLARTDVTGHSQHKSSIFISFFIKLLDAIHTHPGKEEQEYQRGVLKVSPVLEIKFDKN